ncbi:MAG TPA: aminotransferase class I/II-fold pyridoxal phosphate-dependent enzyme [Thermoanaerobaculia bacterium]|jgi:cystathionine gamma-synthase|nr:aminotransferase class I/II-fold pyridoxal phosphate-dependent enzyme [Thermoanaerobaculia bacterium]
MHFDTKAIHAGMHVDEETGAVAPPIHLSTTFERNDQGDPSRGFSYVRDGNPTQSRLEEALAVIDGAEAALVFGSGMAAGAALLQALPKGAHVLLPDDCYYGYRGLAEDYFERWGLSFDVVAMEDLDAVRGAMREETKVVWAESPSNPLLKVVDLRALASIAHANSARFVVDGTFATPALQQPIELGADVVLHSTTKYLGGHTDVQGGSIAFRKKDEWYDDALHVRKLVGGVGSPFNSWLVLRGIRTLAVRMRVHSENAMAVARFLSRHDRVEAVFYPGLEQHPGHEIAKAQMSAFGGMLSFLVRGGRADALAVASKTKLFTRATSLGSTESLIEHRNSSEGSGSRTAENLLRVSVGLEHAGDLVEDLAQALG